jgi:GTP 3',8-cyclase
MGKKLKSVAKNFFVRTTGIVPYRLFARKEDAIKSLKSLVRFKQWPIFHLVTIETSSYCNRKCYTCPVSEFPRDKMYMPQEMFTKITADLVQIGFSGIIHLHFYNEPLADRTILEKVEHIANRLPKAQIRMNSNGDFLTSNLLKKLVLAGLDELYITQYDGKINTRIVDISANASNLEEDVLIVRVKSDFTGNRAGLLSNIVVSEPILADCNRPSHQLIINCRGDVVICCNDYLGKLVLGNVAESSLIAIWNSKQFVSIRRLLRMKKRNLLELCKNCNFLGDIYDCRDLTANEIEAFNRSVQQQNPIKKIFPQLFINSLDRLRMHELDS